MGCEKIRTDGEYGEPELVGMQLFYIWRGRGELNMKDIEYILFDCMETLIDMTEIPSQREYALWAFDRCGYESCWGNFDNFFEEYKCAVGILAGSFPEHRDYEMKKRFELIVEKRKMQAKGNEIVQSLYDNYWDTYSSKCYVRDEVKETLHKLHLKFKLGVVSNFMVKGGIEELLERNSILMYFKFVVTSINTGWRKPHPEIYSEAISKSGVPADRILFVGDDYVCDYEGPRSIGMKSLLLDRNHRHWTLSDTISDFNELSYILL